MPIRIKIGDQLQWIFPASGWKTMPINTDTIEADRNFFIKVKQL